MEQALHAYLDPLLQKHAAGQLIVYEDLLSSWDSSQAVLKQQRGDDEIAQRLKELHDSQVKAYTSAAQKALSNFAKTAALPQVEPGMDESTYVERVCSTLQIPLWKVNPQFVRIIVQKRATQYHKEQVAVAIDNNSTNINGDDDNEAETPDLEDGEDVSAIGTDDTEDDEEEEGELLEADDKLPELKKIVSKNARNNANKQTKKKAHPAKVLRAPLRGRKPSNRGRGRGGGVRGQARPA